MNKAELSFAVVIPAHNSKEWITFALNSVKSQTYQPQEVWVFNDRSDEVLQLEHLQLDGLQCYSVDFGNAAATRNEILGKSSCDYLAFLDADDIWYNNHLERAALLLSQYPEAVGYLNYFDHLGLDGHIIERKCPWDIPTKGMQMTDLMYLEFYKKYKYFTGMSACIIRKDRFEEVKGFDPTFKKRHDIELWWRVIASKTCIVDPTKTSAYRKNVPGSVSSNAHLTEFYKLKGLLKNQDLFKNNRDFQRILSEVSRSACHQSILNGDKEFIQSVAALGYDYLNPKHKLLFQTIGSYPKAYKFIYSMIN
ncbi:glycosyltransferase family A protein [Mongoliitalea lutea]|uniref:Glycosyl transferase n=1 Tax=Mongoliitalea lutea TaxID=849756 RepID=A0A8J3CVV5_9BACT|nr:glycosyltransferase family A protein [Mongoliitalea lutea]GHB31508.1 glycosyl transferase [Mongoliitalea lutea]